MNKKEYMRELEFLLQDLPYNEVRDALDYYYDYFDAAGKENESKVIAELGSPEKVAATIKSELKGTFFEDLEYGESGINQQQYEEFHEVIENENINQQEEKSHTFQWKGDPDRNRILAIAIFIGVVILFMSPVTSIILGLFFAILGIGIFASVGWILLLMLAVFLFVNSCFYLANYSGAGILVMGISFLVCALGILFYLIAKRFFQLIPEIFQMLVKFVKTIIAKVGA